MIARFSGYNQLYIIKLGIFKLFIEITTLSLKYLCASLRNSSSINCCFIASLGMDRALERADTSDLEIEIFLLIHHCLSHPFAVRGT